LSDKQKEELRAALVASNRPVLVRTAFEVEPPQKAAIEAGIKGILGEGTAIEYETKTGLISGVELTANGQKFAWSIADYLTSLTNSVHGLLEPKFEPAPVAEKAVAHAA
jgi:F-type H+-transporting ATPase subunit b